MARGVWIPLAQTWAGVTFTTTLKGATTPPTTTNGKCAQCTGGTGFCMQRVSNLIIICHLYKDPKDAGTCAIGLIDCTKGATLQPTQTAPPSTPKPSTPPTVASTAKKTVPGLETTRTTRGVSTRLTAPPTTSSTRTRTSTTVAMVTTTTTTTPIVKDSAGTRCTTGFTIVTSVSDCTKAAQRLGLKTPPMKLTRNTLFAPGCFYFPGKSKDVYLYTSGPSDGDAPDGAAYICAQDGAVLDTTTVSTQATARPPQTTRTTTLPTTTAPITLPPRPEITCEANGAVVQYNKRTREVECMCRSMTGLECQQPEGGGRGNQCWERIASVIYMGVGPNTFWVDGTRRFASDTVPCYVHALHVYDGCTALIMHAGHLVSRPCQNNVVQSETLL